MSNLMNKFIRSRLSYLPILRTLYLRFILIIRLVRMLLVLNNQILIIFILTKRIVVILRGKTLMLWILIIDSPTILLTGIKILILKLLRILNITIINILCWATILHIHWPVSLRRCVVVYLVSLVLLIHNWTRWFCTSYTLRFLVLKDIGILLSIALWSRWAWSSTL